MDTPHRRKATIELANPLRVAVLGSAHLNVLSHVAPGRKGEAEHVGEMVITYGGSGHNIAVNLVRMGHEVVFSSILADTMISRSIDYEMRRLGITTRIQFTAGLQDAGFSAHLCGGQLLSAVSSIPAAQRELDREMVETSLGAADVCVADCNLAAASLAHIVGACARLDRPLWLSGVSDFQCTKIIQALAGRPEGAALDGAAVVTREQRARLEAALDPAMAGPEDCPPGTPRDGHVARRLGWPVLELAGTSTARLWLPDAREPMECRLQPSGGRRQSEQWLGAVDYLLALMVHLGQSLGCSMREAMDEAIQRVSRLHNDRACHAGAVNPLERHLKGLTNGAFRDRLTGALNRAGLEAGMAALSEEAQVSVLILDIDHFKSINDTFGHDVGDVALREVVRLCQDQLRPSDMLARWGGEEFIVILPDQGGAEAMAVAERIRRKIGGAEIPGIDRPVTISLGVGAGVLADFADLRRAADEALYRAKRGGRDRAVLADAV